MILVLTYTLSPDAEVKAVQVMAAALRENPQSYTLLHVQCDFLRSKGKADWALKLARQAVNCAPSEFVTWAKLTEVYIEMGNFEAVCPLIYVAIISILTSRLQALLTLNSCPMFTYNERDLHRMPTPARTHLPVKQFISETHILEDYTPGDNEVRDILCYSQDRANHPYHYARQTPRWYDCQRQACEVPLLVPTPFSPV